jgi:chromosome segregation ATPase
MLEQFQTLTNRMEYLMATLDESITRLFTDFSNELAGFQTTIDELTTENADLRTQLQPLSDQIAAAQDRVDTKATELEANDPTPEPDPNA